MEVRVVDLNLFDISLIPQFGIFFYFAGVPRRLNVVSRRRQSLWILRTFLSAASSLRPLLWHLSATAALTRHTILLGTSIRDAHSAGCRRMHVVRAACFGSGHAATAVVAHLMRQSRDLCFFLRVLQFITTAAVATENGRECDRAHYLVPAASSTCG